ncbi:MAG: PKD domain-containing protein [Maribacter sp.]
MKNISYKSALHNRKNVALTTLIVVMSVIGMSYGPMFLGPGLTDAEPIDNYLDGVFPNTGFTQDPYEVAFPNLDFDTPLNFTTVPGQNKIVVGQRDGKVFWFDDADNTAVKNPVIDLSNVVGGQVWDGGFLGLSIHPDFGDGLHNYFYVYYSTASNDTTLEEPLGFYCGEEKFHGNYLVLERFEVNPATMAAVPNSKLTMIQRQLYNTTHRGGGMEFGNDGYLWLTTGDQAAYINAQQIDENLDGGVLRLDVDMIGGTTSHAPLRTLGNQAGEADEFSGLGYFIPNDNPFNDPSGAVFEEYFTLGHRNPHRMTKDSDTGIFYIGEVGEDSHEEINIVDPASPGLNYGWPLFEANVPYTPRTRAGDVCLTELYNNMPHTGPLVQFPRSEANAIIGGYVYRGQDYNDLTGSYICGDYGVGGEIWKVDIGVNNTYTSLGNFTPGNMVSWGQDYDGELYILSQGDGVKLYKLRSPEATNFSNLPQTLSDTGIFTDMINLTVRDGVIPYEGIDPFWSDGALKKRWLAVPNDGTHDTAAEQIVYSEDGVWEFPVGSVLIKHFDYPIDENNPNIVKRMETRFSIKGSDGEFYFVTYNWNEAQTDAVLQEDGLDEPVQVTLAGGGTRTDSWHFPNNGECVTCHNDISQGTLGARSRYLNSDYDYSAKGGVVGNQLVTLSELGILDTEITDTDTPGILTHTSINDVNGTLDDKARSYLDLNCAYCHQEGTNNRGDFDLRLFKTLNQTGLLTAGVNEPLGITPDEKIVFAGDANKSVLWHRTNSIVPGEAMPPLAKNRVDEQGVILLQDWINSLVEPLPAPDTGTYRIVNVESGQTLQVEGGSNSNTANVLQGGYQGADNQHFILENAYAGYFELRAVHSNKYLDVAGFGAAQNVNVWQYDGNGSDAQQWEVLGVGNDEYHIVNSRTGKYLGVQTDGNVAVLDDDGTDIFKWRFDDIGAVVEREIVLDVEIVTTSEDEDVAQFQVSLGAEPTGDVELDLTVILNADEILLSDATLTFTSTDWNLPQTINVTGVDDLDVDGPQDFQIELRANENSIDADYIGTTIILDGVNSDNDGGGVAPPDPGIYRVINKNSGQTLEVLASSFDNEANVQQGPYQDTDNEHFEIDYDGAGYYSFIAQHSLKAMDVAGIGAGVGVNVWQYDANGTDAQLWEIVDTGDGDDTYFIISKSTGNYLRIAPDGNIEVVANQNTDIFKWTFLPVGTSASAGVIVSKDVIVVDEDLDSDTFDVSLNTEPTGQVFVEFNVVIGGDEFDINQTQLVFDATNWNIPQAVIITGVDDAIADGAQDFVIDVLVVDPINDIDYKGLGTTLTGLNYDNDGGDNGAPIVGEYRLVNVQTQNTIRAANGGLIQETNLETGAYDGADYQEFELEDVGDGDYALRTLHTADQYLDVQFSNTDPGANIWQYTFNGSNAQLWQIVDAGNNTYHVISKLSGYYLTEDVNGNVYVDEDNGGDIYRWQFLNTGFAPVANSSADILAGNEDLTVQFSSAGSTDDKDDIVSYLWDFGNGDTSNEENPEYVFENGGTYNVILTIEDGDGYEDVADAITVDVNGAPVANAFSNISGGEATIDIAFTGDQSTDDVGIESYLWTFEPGQTSIAANPTYTFTTEGTYDVTLTVTDEDGLEDTISLQVVITPPNQSPVAVATSDIVGGIVPLEVNFTGDQSTDDEGVESYLWTFEPGETSTEANPTYTFNDTGVFTVELTVTDIEGLESTATVDITVTDANEAPVAVATSNIMTGEAALEVQFTGDQSTDDIGIDSYLWTFESGETSTEVNPTYTFATEGTYEVTLLVTDAGGLEDITTVEIIVTVDETPVAVASASVTQGEAPLEVQFTGDQSVGVNDIVSYAWDFGNGDTSTEANPIYTYNTPGVFNATLIVTDSDGLTGESTIEITVDDVVIDNPTAVASADVTSGDAPLVVSFTGDQSVGVNDIVSYEWDFGNGDTSTEANPTYTYNTPGTFDAILIVTDSEGLTGESTIEIIVGGVEVENPTAVASADVTSGEAPLVVSFIGDQSTGVNEIVSYAWDFGDGETSTDANPTYIYNTPGTFIATLIVTDSEGLTGTSTIEITVTGGVNLAPVAVLTSSVEVGEALQEIIFTGDQSSDDIEIVSYAWSFGDGGTSEEVNPVYTFAEPGTYTITLIVTDNGGLTDEVSMSLQVLNDNTVLANDDFEVVLSPNPSVDFVEVSFSGDFNMDDVIGLTVHDMSGRLIRRYMPEEIAEDNKYRISTAIFNNEVYVITLVMTSQEPISKRLVINK